jgi:hypothetical protein
MNVVISNGSVRKFFPLFCFCFLFFLIFFFIFASEPSEVVVVLNYANAGEIEISSVSQWLTVTMSTLSPSVAKPGAGGAEINRLPEPEPQL